MMTIGSIETVRSEGSLGSAHGTPLTAAQRVLAVMGAFDDGHRVLTLSEISRRAGLNLSTAHRIIGELRIWGGLERTPDGAYSIGMRILELGSLEPHGLHLREVALPYLHDLQLSTNANVHLSVLNGHDSVYLESWRVRNGAPVLSRTGGRWPLHSTATGQVMLSFASQQLQDEVLRTELHGYTPMTVTNPDALRHVLASVRRMGFAVVENSITNDAMAVAVPIRDYRDQVIAALGVTMPPSKFAAQSVLPALSTVARAISRALKAHSVNHQAGFTAC